MFSLDTVKALYILVIFNLFHTHMTTADDSKNEQLSRGARSEDGYRGGMWFGPRLGKRSSRTTLDNDRQTFYRLLEAADALKYYYDQLPEYNARRMDDPDTRVTKKVVFTPILGRSVEDENNEKRFEDVNFTPRLGRRRGEDAVTPSDRDSFRNEQEPVNGRSSYFSPRLGRTNMNFSPRLGRELLIDMFPQDGKIRMVRSTRNDTKAT